MPPAGSQLAIPATERPQIDTLDRAANGNRFPFAWHNCNCNFKLKTYRRLFAFGAPKYLSELKISRTKPAEKNITHTVELQLSGLIGTDRHSNMQKNRIIGFFFANRLHWQFEVEKEFLQTYTYLFTHK